MAMEANAKSKGNVLCSLFLWAEKCLLFGVVRVRSLTFLIVDQEVIATLGGRLSGLAAVV